MTKIEKLNKLLLSGIITKEEYDEQIEKYLNHFFYLFEIGLIDYEEFKEKYDHIKGSEK